MGKKNVSLFTLKVICFIAFQTLQLNHSFSDVIDSWGECALQLQRWQAMGSPGTAPCDASVYKGFTLSEKAALDEILSEFSHRVGGTNFLYRELVLLMSDVQKTGTLPNTADFQNKGFKTQKEYQDRIDGLVAYLEYLKRGINEKFSKMRIALFLSDKIFLQKPATVFTSYMKAKHGTPYRYDLKPQNVESVSSRDSTITTRLRFNFRNGNNIDYGFFENNPPEHPFYKIFPKERERLAKLVPLTPQEIEGAIAILDHIGNQALNCWNHGKANIDIGNLAEEDIPLLNCLILPSERDIKLKEVAYQSANQADTWVNRLTRHEVLDALNMHRDLFLYNYMEAAQQSLFKPAYLSMLMSFRVLAFMPASIPNKLLAVQSTTLARAVKNIYQNNNAIVNDYEEKYKLGDYGSLLILSTYAPIINALYERKKLENPDNEKIAENFLLTVNNLKRRFTNQRLILDISMAAGSIAAGFLCTATIEIGAGLICGVLMGTVGSTALFVSTETRKFNKAFSDFFSTGAQTLVTSDMTQNPAFAASRVDEVGLSDFEELQEMQTRLSRQYTFAVLAPFLPMAVSRAIQAFRPVTRAGLTIINTDEIIWAAITGRPVPITGGI